LRALRSSFGRRMTKFFTTALNTVSPSSERPIAVRKPPDVDAPAFCF
jgi:hypothetical protein